MAGRWASMRCRPLCLYTMTLFLMDVRQPAFDISMVKQFFERRKIAIGLFFFGLVVLILLLSLSTR